MFGQQTTQPTSVAEERLPTDHVDGRGAIPYAKSVAEPSKDVENLVEGIIDNFEGGLSTT